MIRFTFLKELTQIKPMNHINVYFVIKITFLAFSWRRFLLSRNQSIDLQSKSMDCFLYDRDLRHKRIKVNFRFHPKVCDGCHNLIKKSLIDVATDFDKRIGY